MIYERIRVRINALPGAWVATYVRFWMMSIHLLVCIKHEVCSWSRVRCFSEPPLGCSPSLYIRRGEQVTWGIYQVRTRCLSMFGFEFRVSGLPTLCSHLTLPCTTSTEQHQQHLYTAVRTHFTSSFKLSFESPNQFPTRRLAVRETDIYE